MNKTISSEIIKFHLVTPFVDQASTALSIKLDNPSIITTNFSDTEIKLGEADFFLKLIEQNAAHQAILYYGLSAFLAAARSITLYLQAEGAQYDGFFDWYKEIQEQLKNDEIAKYLKDTRDKALHARYSKIKTVFDVPLFKDGDKWIHRATDPIYSGFSFVDYLMENGLEKCYVFLEKMKEIIKEAKHKGFLPDKNARGISLQATDIDKGRSFKPKKRT
jgi:hypothetical protein